MTPVLHTCAKRRNATWRLVGGCSWGVRVIVPPSHCVLVPLCPHPIVSPSHCVPIPLCPWTVNNFYDLERKCEISAFLEVLSKRLPVGFFCCCWVFFIFLLSSSETVFNCELLCLNLYRTSNFYDAFFENVRAPAKLLYARTLSVQLRRFVTGPGRKHDVITGVALTRKNCVLYAKKEQATQIWKCRTFT